MKKSKIELRSIKELEYRSKRMHSRFNYKTEETMNKKVSSRNSIDFESDIEAMFSPANELMFLTVGDNHDYAKEVFKTVQKLFVNGSKLILNNGTNEEMNDLVMTETKLILDLLIVIKDDDDGFKSIIKNDKHFFNEKWFIDVAKQIHISNNVAVFINELNGGENALDIKDVLLNPKQKDIHIYGIDRDIDFGADSRSKGILTARGGISEASSFWSDVSFCANHYINFGDGSDYYSDSELYKFYKKKLTRAQGLFIFNYPYYRLDDIRNILRNNELVAAINTHDQLGNIVFVMKYANPKKSSNKTLQKIQFNSEKLPTSTPSFIQYYSNDLAEVKTFRGKYTDLEDIMVEFNGQEDSADFLFQYYEPKNKLEQLNPPLMEYKPGHIPAMAASEIINGRYVDEVLVKKTIRGFGFDHLFSTKIVKREIEEKEEKMDKQGNPIVEISLKKSNVIVSIALTASGEYIELFSNDTEDRDKEKEHFSS